LVLLAVVWGRGGHDSSGCGDKGEEDRDSDARHRGPIVNMASTAAKSAIEALTVSEVENPWTNAA
jgi:hypothetical protein